MKNLVWREFEANDFLMKEISGKVSAEWYNQGKEQSSLNRAEEIQKRIDAVGNLECRNRSPPYTVL